MLAILVAGLTTGCATTQETDDPPTTEAGQTNTASEETYGADPMGTARRWAASPPEEAPEAVSSWSNPVVLRVYRAAEGDYRAVVAASDDREAEAVLLTIAPKRNGEGRWRIRSVERTDATHAWPTN